MRFTVISVVAALLGGLQWRRRPRPTSDDPVGDAYRFRQERRRQASRTDPRQWSDPRQAMRKANGFEGYW